MIIQKIMSLSNLDSFSQIINLNSITYLQLGTVEICILILIQEIHICKHPQYSQATLLFLFSHIIPQYGLRVQYTVFSFSVCNTNYELQH
jgi:hypothetical protein